MLQDALLVLLRCRYYYYYREGCSTGPLHPQVFLAQVPKPPANHSEQRGQQTTKTTDHESTKPVQSLVAALGGGVEAVGN
jgi:hypothetical protein